MLMHIALAAGLVLVVEGLVLALAPSRMEDIVKALAEIQTRAACWGWARLRLVLSLFGWPKGRSLLHNSHPSEGPFVTPKGVNSPIFSAQSKRPSCTCVSHLSQ